MGFLKKFQIGKVAGATLRGFTSGGFYGAVLQGGQAAAISSIKAGTAKARDYGTPVSRVTPTGSVGMYNSAAALMPGYSMPGSSSGGGDVVLTGSGNQPAKVTQDIVNSLATILNKVGARWRQSTFIPTAKRLLARVLATSKRVPGLTPVGMLVTRGLTEMAANQVITWYTTSGRRRRRIRVTNVKALNRSVRRLEGFARLARRVEASLGRRSGGGGVRRIGRCKKCRKSPCGC